MKTKILLAFAATYRRFGLATVTPLDNGLGCTLDVQRVGKRLVQFEAFRLDAEFDAKRRELLSATPRCRSQTSISLAVMLPMYVLNESAKRLRKFRTS